LLLLLLLLLLLSKPAPQLQLLGDGWQQQQRPLNRQAESRHADACIV
jgi:hypothetical protein